MENKNERKAGQMTWGGIGLRVAVAMGIVFLGAEAYQRAQVPANEENTANGYNPTGTKPANTDAVTNSPYPTGTPFPSETNTKEYSTSTKAATRTRIPRQTNTFRPRESKTSAVEDTKTKESTRIGTNTVLPTITADETGTATLIKTGTRTSTASITPSITVSPSGTPSASPDLVSTKVPVVTLNRPEVKGTVAVTGANEYPDNLYNQNGLLDMRALVAAFQAGLLIFVWEQKEEEDWEFIRRTRRNRYDMLERERYRDNRVIKSNEIKFVERSRKDGHGRTDTRLTTEGREYIANIWEEWKKEISEEGRNVNSENMIEKYRHFLEEKEWSPFVNQMNKSVNARVIRMMASEEEDKGKAINKEKEKIWKRINLEGVAAYGIVAIAIVGAWLFHPHEQKTPPKIEEAKLIYASPTQLPSFEEIKIPKITQTPMVQAEIRPTYVPVNENVSKYSYTIGDGIDLSQAMEIYFPWNRNPINNDPVISQSQNAVEITRVLNDWPDRLHGMGIYPTNMSGSYGFECHSYFNNSGQPMDCDGARYNLYDNKSIFGYQNIQGKIESVELQIISTKIISSKDFRKALKAGVSENDPAIIDLQILSEVTGGQVKNESGHVILIICDGKKVNGDFTQRVIIDTVIKK